ncbi:hypothetical protein [Cellulosimicrobium sp. CUA-896]|uniref:hypothetical protein n=1 Tax=Cellulosimicrobium sp. CUA-896 TaxID=1517881 RepID=UPI0009621FD8|nr:hypothetical protein [Cellulosimicrobium sp. CUA-896]OLT50937.1 hypothetical protein BJF88_02180 [Cellulosimicrobium sp. CUA-896]
MIYALTSAYSVPALLGELLGWVLGAVAHVPGRAGELAAEARQVATGWGIPVAEVTDLYATFPVRLALAVAAVAFVAATAALVHGLRERRRARTAAR